MVEKYLAVCLQQESKNATTRDIIEENVRHTCDLVAYAVEGFEHYLPVKLLVTPELNLTNLPFHTAKENSAVAIQIPGPETDAIGESARKYRCYVVVGALEKDQQWPLVFNSLLLIDPKGSLILKYRKVNPWIPVETTCSPHDLLLAGYNEQLFPVAKTPIGNIGCYICYDGLFPEVTRQLALNGAEILIRVSFYPDPYGTQPTDWWSIVNRVRSIENTAYGICCQSGSKLDTAPPYSSPGHSMIVDWEGRTLAEAGRGECIIAAALDIDMLRHVRLNSRLHNMLAHLRSSAYDYWKMQPYGSHPEYAKKSDLTVQELDDAIKESRDKFYKKHYK